jgi:hypothetical protein
MKKLLALTLVFAFCTVHAQTSRRRATKSTRRNTSASPTAPPSPAVPSIQVPVFLTRSGPATINELMIQPPAFSYGSSINIWLLVDENNRTREIAVTGHGDSPTCRRVSGQVMTMFLEKNREPEDFFVAGAAHLIDRGDTSKRGLLMERESVKKYIDAQKELWVTEMLVGLREESPAEGSEEGSSLGDARKALVELQQRVDTLSADPSVQEYLRESRSAEAISEFVQEVTRFSKENGLVVVHRIPLAPVEKAHARVAAAAKSGSAAVVSFDDLLSESRTPEAALFTPVLLIPSGRPLELHIPLARLNVSAFDEARRSNLDETEQAIVGNARQRLATFKEARQDDLRMKARCATLTPAQLRQVVRLSRSTTAEGDEIIEDKPIKMTMEEYCQIQVPLNLRLVNTWIGRTSELLRKIEEDAKLKGGSRILEFNNTTLIDSMLRDWRLPVARSQEAFDAWRAAARMPVWNLLGAELRRQGVSLETVGGEQMVFSVQVSGPEVIVRPLHVIDMARSVVVADPASGATRVVDAWSMRSVTPTSGATGAGAAAVGELVRGAVSLLGTGEREKARAQLAVAFSRDPGAAFAAVEREWLGQFPDTGRRLSEIQRELKPVVEALEWKEALAQMRGNPSTKEELRERILSFLGFLESHPKAPVDLHLIFAMELAGTMAEVQNEFDKQKGAAGAQTTAWEIIADHSRPETPVNSTLTGLGKGTKLKSVIAAMKQARRKEMEARFRKDGYEGERLKQALDLWMSIEGTEFTLTPTTTHKYIMARKVLSSIILADPAPILRKTLQTIMERDPAYWAETVKAAGQPKERSKEWQAADLATQRELTLIESDAQGLTRLEDGLRKSYWGSLAAGYLWTTRSPNLGALLPVVDAAVGDGSTGSSGSYVAVKQKIQQIIEHHLTMTTLTRVQNAASLQTGSETLLGVARARASRSAMLEPFREAIPLRARLWFESGDYQKALETMLATTVPVALYSPGMTWESLTGDAAQKPLAVRARRDGHRVIFEATFEKNKRADVLALDGLSAADADALLKEFADDGDRIWREYGKVSDQILLAPVGLRPALRELRQLMLDEQLLLMKSMVYGRSAPGEEYVRLPQGGTGIGRVLTNVDRVEGDQGREYKIPSLNEVKRAATDKIRSRD